MKLSAVKLSTTEDTEDTEVKSRTKLLLSSVSSVVERFTLMALCS